MAGIKYDQAGNAYKWNGQDWRMFEDRSTLENITLGAGEGLTSLGRGIMQLSPIEREREEARRAQESEAGARRALHDDAPIAAMVGNALPYAATAPLSGGSAIGAAGVMGVDALMGGLSYADSPIERLQNAGMAGAGAGVGLGVSSMAMRVANRINASGQVLRESSSLVDDALAPSGASGFRQGSAGAAQVGDVDKAYPLDPDAMESLFEGTAKSGFDRRATLEALDDAEALGYRVPPGIVNGSEGERVVFEGLQSSPAMRDVAVDELTGHNKELTEQYLIKALGGDAREASEGFTQGTLARVDQRIDSQLSQFHKAADESGGLSTEGSFSWVTDTGRTSGTIDDALGDVIGAHKRSGRFRGAEDPTVLNIQQIKNLIAEEGANGNISSTRMATFRSTLRNFQRQANTQGDTNSAETLADAVNRLDDWTAENVPPDMKTGFDEALQQFRLLQAIDNPGVVRANGTLNANAIDRQLRRTYKAEYARGNRFYKGGENVLEGRPLTKPMDDLFRAVRVQNTLAPIVGDSGTAGRTMVQDILSGKPGQALMGLGRPVARQWIKSRQPSREQLDAAFEAMGGAGDFNRRAR